MSTREKLIDMYLLFWGVVKRQNIMTYDGCSVATASREMSKYNQLHHSNASYDRSMKAYTISKNFKPAFEQSAEAALELFAYGRYERVIETDTFGPDTRIKLHQPLSLEIVSQITRSIVNCSDVELIYYSKKSATSTRWFSPIAIFKSESTWYVRGYDHKRSKFLSLRLSRVKEVIGTQERLMTLGEDEEWLEPVTLTISPHPQQINKEFTDLDLGFSERKVVNMRSTKALAGYHLQELRVDCSKDSSLNPDHFPLALLNQNELLNCDSMSIAPGFNKLKSTDTI